jgi:predicted nicotinamide N-methyase
MREDRIVLAGRELVITRPDDPESLIDEARFDEDEFLPYWADLWPSGVALARHLAGLDLGGKRVIEVGCGLALPSFAAALAGAEVLATDWAPEAIELVVRNAAANGLVVTAAVFDWHSGRAPGTAPFDLVVAADVLYEERNAEPLLALLDVAVAPAGEAAIADPGRRHAGAFFEAARAAGWSTEPIAAAEVPAGGIAVMQRAATLGRG